jgi:plastocyanin
MPHPLALKRPTIAVLAAVGIGAAGFVATEISGADAATTHTAKLSAKASAIKFNKTKITTSAGKLKITFSNPSGSIAPHGVAVEGHGLDKDSKIVTAGKKTTLTVTLKKGTYTFYCPVGDHRSEGMEGKIVVK